jgi:hypothetical protein
MSLEMVVVEAADLLALMSRLGERDIGGSRKKSKYKMAGTRAFEQTVKFIRMAFGEYAKEHPGWYNPYYDQSTPPSPWYPRAETFFPRPNSAACFLPPVFLSRPLSGLSARLCITPVFARGDFRPAKRLP